MSWLTAIDLVEKTRKRKRKIDKIAAELELVELALALKERKNIGNIKKG